VNYRVDRVQDLGHVQLPCKCTFDSCIMINQTSGFCFTVLSVSNEKFGFWFGFFFLPSQGTRDSVFVFPVSFMLSF
jgi:hypothetical protein